MKFVSALLPLLLASASARHAGKKDITPGSITAESKMGQHILSHARRVEENNQNQNQNNQDEEIEFTWVAGYSLKFQGCHHISQWNEEADGEDEPFIQTKRLIRFRLCPTETCTYEDASGCDSGYGDYIIDMNLFLEAYWNNRLDHCEVFLVTDCDCDGENQGDDFNEEYCEYDCFMDNNMDWCVDENPYQQNDNNQDDYEEIEPEQYMECANWDIPDNNRRKLEQEEIEYFIGPYCSDQGGKVYLGVFTDEFCTNFADNQYVYGADADEELSHVDFYKKMTGHNLPYASESLVDMDCVTCKEFDEDAWQNNYNGDQNNNNNDAQDEDEVVEMCEELYAQAGKCESSLEESYLRYPNENGCNYIEGIKIVRKDGIVVQGSAARSKTASIFIGLFAVAFVLLGAYVYYLKTKLDRAKINISE